MPFKADNLFKLIQLISTRLEITSPHGTADRLNTIALKRLGLNDEQVSVITESSAAEAKKLTEDTQTPNEDVANAIVRVLESFVATDETLVMDANTIRTALIEMMEEAPVVHPSARADSAEAALVKAADALMDQAKFVYEPTAKDSSTAFADVAAVTATLPKMSRKAAEGVTDKAASGSAGDPTASPSTL